MYYRLFLGQIEPIRTIVEQNKRLFLVHFFVIFLLFLVLICGRTCSYFTM